MRLFKKGDRVKVTFDNSSHIVLQDQPPGYDAVMLDHFTLSGIKGECFVNSEYIKLIAPEQTELKAGMFVEHKRYGIAKVKDLDGYLFLKIPGFKGIVAAQPETLEASWKTQEKLKADYHAARKRVWEESEAGKATREKEKSSVSFQDILRSEVLKAWSINFPGMMPVIERMKKTEDALKKEETKPKTFQDTLIAEVSRIYEVPLSDLLKAPKTSATGKAAREKEKNGKSFHESPTQGFLSSIKVVASEVMPKGAFMFGTINHSEAEELKKKEKNMAVDKHINTLMCSPNPTLSGGLRDLFVMAEELKKKEETKRYKVGDMLTMPGEVFSYEVIKDTGGEFIHVKNQITGIVQWAVKRKDVSPILDARISDTGKVLNAKTADIYAKTDEAPASGADRLNAGKLQWSLVDFTALEPMVRVLMKGAQKYSPDNWKKGLSYTSILDSTMRHMSAFKAGEDLDPETGEPHTAHMLCNLMFLAWEELNRKDLDNRKPDLSK